VAGGISKLDAVEAPEAEGAEDDAELEERHRPGEEGQHVPRRQIVPPLRKVDVRLPGKGNSNSHGARPVHLIIPMIKWRSATGPAKKVSMYHAVR